MFGTFFVKSFVLFQHSSKFDLILTKWIALQNTLNSIGFIVTSSIFLSYEHKNIRVKICKFHTEFWIQNKINHSTLTTCRTPPPPQISALRVWIFSYKKFPLWIFLPNFVKFNLEDHFFEYYKRYRNRPQKFFLGKRDLLKPCVWSNILCNKKVENARLRYSEKNHTSKKASTPGSPV